MSDPQPLKLFLHYPDKGRATRRIAEGKGDLYQRVKDAAEGRGLPLGANQDLVQLCARVDVGERLSGQLLDVIAETIGWLRAAGQAVVAEAPPEPPSTVAPQPGNEHRA